MWAEFKFPLRLRALFLGALHSFVFAAKLPLLEFPLLLLGFHMIFRLCASYGTLSPYDAYSSANHLRPYPPWRCGGMAEEWGASFIYVRVVAYAARTALDSPARRICVGGPVVGFAESSSGRPMPLI